MASVVAGEQPDHELALRLHLEELERAAAERDDLALALALSFQLQDQEKNDGEWEIVARAADAGEAQLVRAVEQQRLDTRELAEALVFDDDESLAQELSLRHMREYVSFEKLPPTPENDRLGRHASRPRGALKTVGGKLPLALARQAPEEGPRLFSAIDEVTAPLGVFVGDTVSCEICLERVSAAGCFSANLRERNFWEPCGHFVCAVCTPGWLKNEIEGSQIHPRCPCFQHCSAYFDKWNCRDVLSQHSDSFKKLSSFHTADAKGLRNGTLMYCPLGCNSAVQAQGSPKDWCKTCEKDYCKACATPWHHGMSCKEYQKLPAHLKTNDDVALLNHAYREVLRPCPRCRHLVEKNPDGCNHIVCRCACHFCYACGAEYQHNKPTAWNAHGKPSCKCELFGGRKQYGSVSDVAEAAGV